MKAQGFHLDLARRASENLVMNRRAFLAAGGALLALAGVSRTMAQWQPSERYPDPAVRIIDPSFTKYRVNTAKVEKI